MEPMSIVGGILKLLKAIAKAEKEARQNRTRCRELARRAEVVASVLRDSKASARGDAPPTRRRILGRLKDALDDALKLVESCQRRDGLFYRLVNSRAKAAKFNDIDKRITSCLVDLNAATGVSMETKINQLADAARGHPGANKSKQTNAGNTPPKGAVKNDNKGEQKGGGKGGKRRRGKKVASAARPPVPPLIAHGRAPFYPNGHGYTYPDYHHSIEEDPTSCAVM
ncbi:hypothetical protein BS78_05G167900 [Paspalum vaginatum]|uniref:DUF7792 domain-containing protein n=1 Tax=Paspalum vaginatum TaxID=158149 RepID=A0A9W7X9Y7_9POAL|nr:hypothetical protein BS78_K271100 [Paspalum vaginatum]KAJ1275858.1 hypothetical protein BS78_05G167900 [Paspalum vaginatum]